MTQAPARPARQRPWRRVLLATVAVSLVLAGLAVPASAQVGGPLWTRAAPAYKGDFPDPTVLRVGDGYYAYATDSNGSYLPVLHSTDLRTWTAGTATGSALRTRYHSNDALPSPAGWAAHSSTGPLSTNVWAPGVIKIGDRYLAYYAVSRTVSPAMMCISVATSAVPTGPFVDTTSAPLVCEGRAPGSIDPSPYLDGNGTLWLTWAGEGPTGTPPTKLWSRQLTADGLGFVPGSASHELIRETQAWEHPIVENPSMIRYRGVLYLFYSANSWFTGNYGLGYAICATPVGPCNKPRSTPLIASNSVRQGPGGPSPFVDKFGALRLAYHTWTGGKVGYENGGARSLAVTTVRPGASGLLSEVR